MWLFLTSSLRYLLSTPDTHKHLYSENYIPTVRARVRGRNIGSWVRKAYKHSAIYLQKQQSLSETWREVASGTLIRELTTLTVERRQIFCAPQISLTQSYFGGQIFTLSMRLEEVVSLFGNFSSWKEAYQCLPEIANYPEIFAVCFLTGQFDLHTGNLGIIEYRDKQYMAKMDHGQAFGQYTSRSDPNGFLSDGLCDYCECGFPPALLLSPEFADGLESVMEKATDRLIISSLAQGLHKLYRNSTVAGMAQARITPLERLVECVRLNKYNLLNLARLIRLRCSIREGNIAGFRQLLDGPWHFFRRLTDLRFCESLTAHSDVWSHFIPVPALIEALAPDETKEAMLCEYENRVASSDTRNMVGVPALADEDHDLLEAEKIWLAQLRQSGIRVEKRIVRANTVSLIFGSSVLASIVLPIPPVITQALGITASYLWSQKNESRFGTYLMAAGATLYYIGLPALSVGVMAASSTILIANMLQRALEYDIRSEPLFGRVLGESWKYWFGNKLSEYSTWLNYRYDKEKTA